MDAFRTTERNQQSRFDTAPALLRTLLASAIDYAGLFPPAGLGMTEAVRNYASYRETEVAWALGRFVVPASRLEELEAAQSKLAISGGWQLSCLMGEDLEAESRQIHRFLQSPAGKNNSIETVEMKLPASGLPAIAPLATSRDCAVYWEVSIDASVELLQQIHQSGTHAKIRTGGLVPEAIPATRALALFLTRCVAAGASFKATAGLHHPLRCLKPLTYELEAPRARMHGFLNVMLASVLALDGADEETLMGILDADQPDDLRFDGESVRWDDRVISVQQIREARTKFLISFGSCSFEEPFEDLRNLKLL